MRNIFLFILFLFVTSGLFCGNAIVAYAASSETGMITSVTPTPEKQSVEYSLPYPGLLPDHPLYIVKKIRDSILESLIVDPTRKAEFYLLQADKYLQMSVALSAKGNHNLAAQVLASSVSYFGKSVSGLTTLKSSSQPVPGYLTERLERAVRKHLEVLGDWSTAGGGEIDAVANATSQLTGMQGKIAALK